MQAIQNALQKWLFPIAQKLEQQRHLQSVKDGVGCDHSDHYYRIFLYDPCRFRKPVWWRVWSLGQ